MSAVVPPPQGCILVMNAGSSSLKFSLYEIEPATEVAARLQPLLEGEIDSRPSLTRFDIRRADGTPALSESYSAEAPGFEQLLARLMQWLQAHLSRPLVAAGHRVVHGGPHYSRPVRITAQVRRDLQAAVPLMPLHLPHNLAPVDWLSASHPELPQIACFDTGFHASVPPLRRLFGLPRALADAGVVRYGFHGLSYEYIASQLPRLDPALAQGKVVVAHLGNGASVCALQAGRSVATSMGFSALDGLVMGTRCGALDPGVLLYLLRERGMNADQLEHLLYHESGLLGLSGGISSDMRELLASEQPQAAEAVEVFVQRAIREIGALATTMGGMDALIFTAGIGEHASDIRRRIAAGFAWLGLHLDEAANAAHGPALHAAHSRLQAWAVPTDEDGMIARHCLDLLSGAS